MKFFVTGVGGQLGHDVMNELSSRGHEGVGSDIAPSYSGIADGTPVTTMPYVQLDITDKKAVAKVIREVNPDAVVHCAAWTAVDAAEDEENRKKVRLVNVVGTQNIADICKELGKPESLITHVTDRKGHDMRYAIDPTKIHNELGWLPETKFADGIKKTIKWYLDNKEWWETIISGEYQNYYEKMYGNREEVKA